MKKMIAISVLLFVFTTIIFIACSELKSDDEKLKLLKLNDYAFMGDTHNKIMSYAIDNFQIDETIVTKKAAIEYVGHWTVSNMQNITETFDETLKEEVDMYINNLDIQELKDRLRRHETRAIKDIDSDKILNNKLSLDESICIAKECGAIDNFEAVKFREIGDKLLENSDGKLSNEELKKYLLSVVSEWENQIYNKKSDFGQALGMTLAVSLASLEYWEENPQEVGGTRMLPAWIGCDIAGAAVGGLVNIARAFYREQPVDWYSVADSVVLGAATGSLGVVGKIGNWISRLF